jgi:hypothetical protein
MGCSPDQRPADSQVASFIGYRNSDVVEHPVQQTRNSTGQAPSCHSEPRVGGPHRSSCMHGTAYLHHTLFTVTDEQPQPLQSDQQRFCLSNTLTCSIGNPRSRHSCITQAVMTMLLGVTKAPVAAVACTATLRSQLNKSGKLCIICWLIARYSKLWQAVVTCDWLGK